MKHCLTAFMMAVVLLSCVREENLAPELETPSAIDNQLEANYIQGEARVYLSEELAEMVEHAAENGTVETKSPGMNAAMSELGITEMYRLFPHAGEFEERTRAEGLHRWYVVKYSHDVAVTKAQGSLEQVPGIDIFEPVRQIKINDFNDLTSEMWGLYNQSNRGFDINVKPVWEEYTVGNPDVIVSVVDDGIDLKHEDLAANCLASNHYNAVTGTSYIKAGDHGTHVAGTIAAVSNNGKGVAGIAGGDKAKGLPGVKLMSCQIFQENADGSTTGVGGAAGIKWGADHGAVISQNSWGYNFDADGNGSLEGEELTRALSARISASDKAAVDYFIKYAGCDNKGNQLANSPMKGGVVIFAAGNDNIAMGAPAEYDAVIAVGSVASNGTKSTFSNYGDWVDVCAPGTTILSTVPGSQYTTMSGTSMACPHVSGVAALGLSYAAQLRKHFTADEFKAMLYETATPIDQYMKGDKQYQRYVADLELSAPMQKLNLNNFKGGMGSGQVNAYALLKAVEGSGVDMTFPNLLIAEGGSTTVDPSVYMPGESFSIVIDDTSVASVEAVGSHYVFKGLKAGQTTASVTGSRTDRFVVTVRENASGNGWL